jgi:hypothetical protein
MVRTHDCAYALGHGERCCLSFERGGRETHYQGRARCLEDFCCAVKRLLVRCRLAVDDRSRQRGVAIFIEEPITPALASVFRLDDATTSNHHADVVAKASAAQAGGVGD